MLCLLLSACLTAFLAPNEPPTHGAAPKEARVKPPLKTSKADDPTKAAEPSVPGDAGAKGSAKAPEKAASTRLPSPAIPAEEGAPVAPRRAPRPVKRTPPTLAAPRHASASPMALDARAARLEAENARLRQQLSLSGGGSPYSISDSKSALQELVAGNKRFVDGARVRTLLSMQDAELREHLSKGQAPFAVIITCSDSRLADNLIFDQELGRLFTIREAGNCPDAQSLASVEYAVEHLGAKVVVVMGHVGCGAVKAVSDAHGTPLPGNQWSLQAGMTGLLESVPMDPNEEASDRMYRLVERNARRQAQVVLDRSDLVRGLVAKGKLALTAAMYDLITGKVLFLAPLTPQAASGGHGHVD